MNKPLEIYLYLPNHSAGARLMLPATPYEILDALDRARITDEGTTYCCEICECEPEYLPQFIAPGTNIYELNHLAQRLAAMDKWQFHCFEGMTMMDAMRNNYSPIPIDRLINMTHSIDTCQIAYEAFNNASLGKFYVENGFPVVPENLPEEAYAVLDYEAIGKKAREAEGGVFTLNGYVVQSGEIVQTYQRGEAIPIESPEYIVLLEVKKGFFNDPAYDNDLTATLKLPAGEDDLRNAMIAIEAASKGDCVFTAIDCAVPQLTETITAMLDATEGDCYGAVSELAEHLRRLSQRGGQLMVYKAMLESAPCDLTLEEAIDLACKAEEFSLVREVVFPEEYGKHILSKYCIEHADVLFESANLRRYGEVMMAQQGVSLTEYGALWSLTGTTVEQILNRPPNQALGMEMK